jgi:predicted phage terminase large subunit-like protein
MIDELTIRTARKAEAVMAQKDFFSFVRSMSPKEYQFEWFHKTIANKLQDVYEGKITRLMIFVPPQHGKSENASRLFPAWCLGKNPKLKIVGSSYSADLAQGFSRSIQRIIDSDRYHSFFPKTYLNNSNVRTDSKHGFLRNADVFETVGFGGSYKAVGVCGSLTGNPADIALIDDPVKDAIEAYSLTYRERVWDWYLNVLSTRLHNSSKIVLIMTRWHMDDLAGRILEDYKKGGQKWDIVTFPAIKEGQPSEIDPRSDGQALWPNRHSLEKILNVKRMSLRVFNSLYQQNPAPDEGSIFKRSWFSTFTMEELTERATNKFETIQWHFRIDTAYTEKQTNDPTGMMCYAHYKGDVYIKDWLTVRKEMPELIQAVKDFAVKNGYTIESSIKIEPKASGLSLIQMLKKQTGLNVSAAKNPSNDKIVRANVIVPFCESGKVHVLSGAGWVEDFLYELTTFPVGKHDEAIDCLVMALHSDSVGADRSVFGFKAIS